MTNNLLQLKIKQRLNKLASFDFDNIECWQIQEAFNKVQLEWTRRQLHGNNAYKEGAEQSITRIDDLQVLITREQLKGVNQDLYFDSEKLPKDYMRFVRISSQAQSDCCPPRKMSVYLAEEANVSQYMSDNNTRPSFEWGETFCSINSNRIRIYTEGKFELVAPELIYYRKPKDILLRDCVNPNTDEIIVLEQECEFKDDIVELLIDETCAILAGDIESQIQMQRSVQNAERNN